MHSCVSSHLISCRTHEIGSADEAYQCSDCVADESAVTAVHTANNQVPLLHTQYLDSYKQALSGTMYDQVFSHLNTWC